MRLLSTSFTCAFLVTAAQPALAFGDPASDVLFVRANKLVVRPGHVLEDAQVVVRDGVIAEVGTDLAAPDDAQLVEGDWVCAGFIDAWSTLGVDSKDLSESRADAATRAIDALDLDGQDHLFEQALRAGVTAVRTQAAQASKVSGVGAVVRLDPNLGYDDAVVLADSNVAAGVGLSVNRKAVDIFDRQGDIDKLVGDLEGGLKYIEDQNEYRYEIEEWRKAIAEKTEELEKDFKKAKKDREKRIKSAKEKGKDHKEKKYKEDRQPREPKFNEEKEMFGRVANGEVALIVEVHRAAELRSLLKQTKPLTRLRMIIAGATEAMAVADQLAARAIPVIIYPAPLGQARPDEWNRHDLALASRLSEKGVQVILGSGGSAAATRDLPLLSALAIAHGLDRDAALAGLTLNAAKALDVGDRLGSVEAGKDAELLVLDGAPLSSQTRVRYVISGGRLVITPEN